MTTIEYHHSDCRNFAPVDVIKGICHISKEIVSSDESACKKSFERLKRCFNCRNYEGSEKNPAIGTCNASKKSFMSYGNMTSETCKMFNEQ